MALPVVLKSGKNYITLVLDSEMDFPTLLQHIVSKFIEAQKFFNHESIALKFDGRKLEEKEKLIILDAIDEYTTITISQIIENDEVMEYAVEKAAFDKLNAKMKPKQLTIQDIANVIESWTKIPVTKITEVRARFRLRA